MKEKLIIQQKDVDAVNQMLVNPDSQLLQDLCDLVEKFGGAVAINEKAKLIEELKNIRTAIIIHNIFFI